MATRLINMLSKFSDKQKMKKAIQKCDDVFDNGTRGKDEYQEWSKCKFEAQQEYNDKWSPNSNNTEPAVSQEDAKTRDDQPTDGFANDGRRIITEEPQNNPLNGVLRNE